MLEILRSGAYQLLYMDVPAYAAVSQSVEHVKAEIGDAPSGFANAVLRNVEREGGDEGFFPTFESDPAAYLSTWGSHPEWLVRRWLRRWPAAEVRALVDANNRKPRLHLVPLAESPEATVERLLSAGIEAETVGLGTRCVRLGEGATPMAALEAVPDAIVQGPGANLVVCHADVPPGTKVADLCAAPGGKALAVSDGPLYTLAADRSESRLRMVQRNARRTGRHLGLVVADALQPPISGADVVLVDAPCSGTGTLARRPDVRWRLTLEGIAALASLQGRLLAAAAEVLPPGGLLLYSTCTLEPEENRDVVDGFLQSHADFRLEPTPRTPKRYVDHEGRLEVMPQETGFDGAFAARMRRAA